MWHSSRLPGITLVTLFSVASALALPACSNGLDELFCEPECPVEAGAEAPSNPGGEGTPSATEGGLDDGGVQAPQTPSNTEPAAVIEQEAPPPLLPYLPDLDVREACEDCAKDACAVQRADCLEDDLCTAQLRCNGECSDPGCRESCRGAVGLSVNSRLFQDLVYCVFRNECGTSCKRQANWGCVDDFDWPFTAEPSRDAYVRFGVGEDVADKLPLAGVNVNACCGLTTQDPVLLDAANGAHLTLPGAYFLGYFELSSDEVRGGMHQRVHHWPVSPSGEVHVTLHPQYELTDQLGWLPSASTAALVVLVTDCTGAPATSVSFRISEQPKAKVAHFGLVGLNFAVESSFVGFGFFPELSAMDGDVVTVQAVLADDSGEARVVAQRQIEIRAGWLSQLNLAPRSNAGF